MKNLISNKRLELETGNNIGPRSISYGMKRKITITSIISLIVIGIGVNFVVLSGQGERIIKVSGSITAPRTHTPIAGVDLAVGDTSIRTEDSGHFIFSEVSTEIGMRLTHPELLRAVVKLPNPRLVKEGAEVMDIPFDIPLYNRLITIVDREARGNLDTVYNHLAPRVQEKLSREIFQKEYKPLFREEDITNQEIVVQDVARMADYYNEELDLRFSNIIEFKLVNDDMTKWYRFVYQDTDDGPVWQLIL